MVLTTLTLASPMGSEAHAHVISPRQLVEIVDVGNLAVSPDGEHVAFRAEKASVERNTYDTIWYVQRLDGHAPPRRVGEGGVVMRESDGASLTPVTPTWSPDGQWLYYIAHQDDRTEVWRAAVDGSKAAAVTFDAVDVREFWLSPDGKTLKYRVGADRSEVGRAEMDEYHRGIRIDASVPVGQPLFRSGNLKEQLETQRLLDNEVIRYPLLFDAGGRWKSVDLEAGASKSPKDTAPPPVTAVAAGIKRHIPTLWRFSREPQGGRTAVLFHSREWTGAGPMPEVVLAVLRDESPTSITSCTHELCKGASLSDVQWRPGSDQVLFTVTDAGRSQAQSIFAWDTETGTVDLVARTNGLLNGGRSVGSSCGVTWHSMVCVAADALSPPRLVRISLESHAQTTLFEPNASTAHDMRQVDVRLLRWNDGADRRFSGWYFPARTTEDQLPPLFITYYRCSGFLRGGVGDEWPLVTLAGHGISSLCINAPPLEPDAVVRYEAGRSAVESAVDLLASSGEIDRAKVGMGGLSFGTEVTFWVLMNSNVVSVASVGSNTVSAMSHLFKSLHGEAYLSRRKAYWQFDTVDGSQERWNRLSPSLNLDRIQAPVLMQLPEQEYLQALDYAIPLLGAGRAELYAFPHEPHNKFQPKHKLAVYERNLDWFRFWLLGQTDPEPSKSEQYRQWRNMVPAQRLSAVP